MKLAGKVLVVTGAGSGIGRAVVLEAVRRAGRVAAVDLNATTLAETAVLAAADGAVSTHVLNITDKAAVEALPAQVIAQLGVVDGLVHCAGIIQPFAKLQDLEYGAIELPCHRGLPRSCCNEHHRQLGRDDPHRGRHSGGADAQDHHAGTRRARHPRRHGEQPPTAY